MQRRNRRRKVHTFPIPLPLAGVLSLAVILAIVYVWLQARCEELGRQVRALEKLQTELQKKLAYEEYRWARMRSPEGVAAALARHRIAMDWPRPDQIVYLPEGEGSERGRVAMARAGKESFAAGETKRW